VEFRKSALCHLGRGAITSSCRARLHARGSGGCQRRKREMVVELIAVHVERARLGETSFAVVVGRAQAPATRLSPLRSRRPWKSMSLLEPAGPSLVDEWVEPVLNSSTGPWGQSSGSAS